MESDEKSALGADDKETIIEHAAALLFVAYKADAIVPYVVWPASATAAV